MSSTYPTPSPLPKILLQASSAQTIRAKTPGILRLLPGCYYQPQPGPVWQQQQQLSLARCVAAAARNRHAIALTHESAALVHGLWVRSPEPDVHLAFDAHPGHSRISLPAFQLSEVQPPIPSAPSRSGPQLRRRFMQLTEDELVTVSGLRVTSWLRTAVDCCFDLPPQAAVTVVDSALRALLRPSRTRLRSEEQTWTALRAELLKRVLARGPRKGSRRARAVAQAADPWSESPGESQVRLRAVALGLPPLVSQHELRIRVRGQVRRFFIDLAWPGLGPGAGVALEFDGRSKYGSAQDLWDEKSRQDALTNAGWKVLRLTGEHLRDCSSLDEELCACLPAQVVRVARPVAALWS
ncbi:Uncharacterised protein [Actinomyces bovis]|uniref:DUF559 domain-containing protein n=1 Tax=Actinomyces bovis TaxID=1658 RepID=A0ABY1VLU0_9ACTO|nr:hypothetical protein [Actinomyces bovis]SPT53074.1 Uncharacterised protein [Actinomyces bovis]VEG52973.1 Uncharacterised protein [Actinomyces israelii]